MSTRRINWYKYAAPANFYPLAGKMIPFFTVVTVLLFIIGLYVGFLSHLLTFSKVNLTE